MQLGLLGRATLALTAVGLIPLGVVPVLVGLNRDAMTDQLLKLHSVAATTGAERVAAAVDLGNGCARFKLAAVFPSFHTTI